MKRVAWRLFPWLLVLLNGVAVLGFRSTITLDGPMHVLHAMADAPPTDSPLAAHEVAYIPPGTDTVLPDATRAILAPLTRWAGPFGAHQAMLALVVVVLCASVLLLATSMGMPPLFAVAWALPLAFGIPLLLGFFGFLMGVAVVLFGTALWWRHGHVGPKALLALLGLVLLAGITHRSSAVLLLLLITCTELAAWLAGPKEARLRWRALPWRMVRWPLLIAVLIAAAYIHILLFQGEPHEAYAVRDPLGQLLSMSSLHLFRPRLELPFLVFLGGGLLLLLGRSLYVRWRHGPRFHPWDGLLLAALLLLLASFVADSPKAHLYFLVERSQWLSLLLLGLWALCFLRLRHTWLIPLSLFAVHGLRLALLERSMAHFAVREQLLTEVAGCLPAGAVVVPMGAEPVWPYLHQGAFVAALHNGVVWSPVDHMRFRFGTRPTAEMTAYAYKRAEGWQWLEEHMAGGHPPQVDALLLWGPEGDWPDAHAQALGEAWFTPQCSMDGATVYVRRDGEGM